MSDRLTVCKVREVDPVTAVILEDSQLTDAVTRRSKATDDHHQLIGRHRSVHVRRHRLQRHSLFTLLTELWFYVSLDTKQVTLDTFSKPISCLGMEKLNLMQQQQKHAFTNQK